MTMHHPLASLATLVVVFAGAVGALPLPLGLYGGGYYPITNPVLPYLGQFGLFYQRPYIPLNTYNPFQRYFYLILPDKTITEIPDIPSPILSNKKKTNWILNIMKWPGWGLVIKDKKTKEKWNKLVDNMSNFTDINNPEWSKQLRQWIANQPNVVQLFSKVYGYMEKSLNWEDNIKVWLEYMSISDESVSSFKEWMKKFINGANTSSSGSTGTEPQYGGFPSTRWQPSDVPWQSPSVPWQSPSVPWQSPSVPWQPPSNLSPDFGFDEYADPKRRTDLSEFDEPPSEPEDLLPPYYPPLCTNYECYPSPPPPPPPLPNFPQFPSDLPQFQPPQFPIFSNPYFEGPEFDKNPFYDEGREYELPNLNIRQIKKVSATENQTQNQIETILDTQTECGPQCEDVSIILDMRRSNVTFCKAVLTAPRQSLKNLLILASYENECFNLKTKIRDSRLRGTTGEYIFSLNGLPETKYNYWISYEVNGTKDTELNKFQPQNGDFIIIDYTDWKTIINKIATIK